MTKCQNLGILVRDDTARDELRRQVGEIGLIMWVFSLPTLSFDVMSKCVDRTLYESKGLEFDDVHLFLVFFLCSNDFTFAFLGPSL